MFAMSTVIFTISECFFDDFILMWIHPIAVLDPYPNNVSPQHNAHDRHGQPVATTRINTNNAPGIFSLIIFILVISCK